jgi:hypothetical protein
MSEYGDITEHDRRDLEALERLRAHEDFSEWLVGLQDATRHGGECSALLAKLLRGEAGHG